MSEFRCYTCWDPAVVRDTIFSDVGAIGLEDDALFLATHVSLPMERTKPARDVVTEAAVLQRLEDAIEGADHKNLVIAITGPSGSGKSHIVRWVRAHIERDDPRLHVVYIPRRVTSLREITHLLLQQLGGSLAEELEFELDRAFESFGQTALAEILLNRISELLKFRPPVGNARYAQQLLPLLDDGDEGQGRGGIPYLLTVPRIREHLLRPAGVLARLAESMTGSRSRGDEDRPTFTAEELGFDRLNGVRAGLPNHASTALRILSTENGRIDAALLLNSIRDSAIQGVLGMRQGRGLREVFADARQRLRGQQLVLLFEDLALMDFVEGAVLDEFANHGDPDHAALRVIFAVTDDKYATLAETIEGRVTESFHVGEVPLHGLDEDEDIERRNEFVARYLNAARVGRDRIVQDRREERPISNACDECDFRKECHSAFSFVNTDMGAIGFYPYNPVALTHALAKQFDDRHRDNRVLTPRVVIDKLIDFVLLRSYADLKSQEMPSEQLTDVLNDGSALISPVDLVPEFAEGTPELNRVFRVRSYWFNQAKETPGVAAAFGLPVPGEVPEPPPPPPVGDDAPSPTKRLPEIAAGVLAWEQGRDLDPRFSQDLRQLLRSLTEDRMDLDRYLIHSTSPTVKQLVKSALGDASFNIEGASGAAGGDQLRFLIPRSNAGSRLLIGAVWFRDHQHWMFDHVDRRWDLPKVRKPEDLAVELEAFLYACAYQVESAVVATVSAQGEDPVQVAVHLQALARQVAPEGDGTHLPSAWLQAAEEATVALSSAVARETVEAFAAARQGPQAKPAVIDSIRTATGGRAELPGRAEGLRASNAVLAQRWIALRDAVDSAIEPTINEIREAVTVLLALLETDSLAEVGEAALLAARAANNERAFAGPAAVVDFEDAAKFLRQSRIEPTAWAEWEKIARESPHRLAVVLQAIPGSGELLQTVEALQLVQTTLTDTRSRLDAQINDAGGPISLDEARSTLIHARDVLVSTLSSSGSEQL